MEDAGHRGSHGRDRNTKNTVPDEKQREPTQNSMDMEISKNPIDDMPIPVKHKGEKPKTFEQLLEAELAREAKGREPTAEAEPESKKSFLKRKSIGEGTDKKKGGTSAKKSYRYYVDNF